MSDSNLDFRALDFDRLWAGRDHTTRVERGVLERLLGPTVDDRVVEIGPGAGRLTPVLVRRARTYVALDLHREFLAPLDLAGRTTTCAKIVGDGRRLPFAGESFDLAVVVRVFNFQPDPAAFLREVRRVLRPGGRLLLGYQPRPSFATLVDDVANALAGRSPPDGRSMTFTRAERVGAFPSSFPAWLPTRRTVRAELRASGFAVARSVSTGLEDYGPGRRLPPEWFVRAAELADHLHFLPSQFVLAAAIPAEG